jgi:hypothetical protein
MGKVLSLRLNDADEVRLSGAAAVNGVSLSAYIKWLIGSGRSGIESGMGMVLHRLDDLVVSMEDIRAVIGDHKPAPVLDLPPKAVIAGRLKERGVPSSTIRQVEAVLDELGGKKTRGGSSS